MIGVNQSDILNYVLRELGYLSSNIEKVYAKYSAMPKREYNKLVYRILKEYNRYFKPSIQDRVTVINKDNSYVATYTYYIDGVKGEIALHLN